MTIIIKLTKHAQDKMIFLGITKEQIKNAILRGSKFKQTDGYLAVYSYLKVAYKIIEKDVYKIKTIYIAR
ncbi:MAG: DUF4258 domain-containing protein [Nanoarchaeota archaeon]